jgi:tetratricopeptide (TPR) repeat protein
VGGRVLDLLSSYKNDLRREVGNGIPRVIVLTGSAGSGKSRLAEELRDEAQALAFVAKVVRFNNDARGQQDVWRLLFRWLFGLDQNPFRFAEEDLLGALLQRLDGGIGTPQLRSSLQSFLIGGRYEDSSFDRNSAVGPRMMDAIIDRIHAHPPLLIHIEDAHNLGSREMQPLYLLRHIAENIPGLSLCVLVTGRTHETLVERPFDHFVRAIHYSNSINSSVEEIPGFTRADARDLIGGALGWPEFLSHDSEVADLIIDRAGLNVFTLVQTLAHIAVDAHAVKLGHGEHSILVDPAAFKAALRSMPRAIGPILNKRFDILAETARGAAFLDLLATIALVGREASAPLVERAVGRAVGAVDVEWLRGAGYLAAAPEGRLLLAHDLLRDALLGRRVVVAAAAEHLVTVIGGTIEASAVGDEVLASIYFRAGTHYSAESWKYAESVMRVGEAHEDFRRILDAAEIVKALVKRDPKTFTLDYDLRWIIAGAHQHSGNTQVALDEYKELMEDERRHLTRDERAVLHVAECATEAANQSYLRLQLTPGQAFAMKALSFLEDPFYAVRAHDRNQRAAVAHNRLGAMYLVAGREDEAETHFQNALRAAEASENHYLISHTLSDLASLRRFRDPDGARHYIELSRETWRAHIGEKQRRRIMLDYAEQYGECLATNDYSHRSRLLATASDAAERGLLFQAAEALICCAACAIEASELDEAISVLVKVLNLTALTEDLRCRIFAFHYLGVCAAAKHQLVPLHDYLLEVELLSSDPMFEGTEIRRYTSDARAIIEREGLPARIPWRKYNLV